MTVLQLINMLQAIEGSADLPIFGCDTYAEGEFKITGCEHDGTSVILTGEELS